MAISVFDLFKIGIGPSSSHTVGPMRAAFRFILGLEEKQVFENIVKIEVELYGSLALTGIGHGTDKAILLGLLGEKPDEVDPSAIEAMITQVKQSKKLLLAGKRQIDFSPKDRIIFHRRKTLPYHPNGMKFHAFDQDGSCLHSRVYYSIGGGFVVNEETAQKDKLKKDETPLPFPFLSGQQLLSFAESNQLSIAAIQKENELTWRSESELHTGLDRIWATMKECIERGCQEEGVLPGPMKVPRRAPKLYQDLTKRPQNSLKDPLSIMDWVNLYALAVNEENAAGSRVVTAPTNGAAGIIPAVMRYYEDFWPGADQEGIYRFLLTAAAIGILYAENASISGAEVGCQGEVGVACSMAAGGLVAALKGAAMQVEQAAEIGMEHNLGLTCDPIGGLVQIPCIERNAMGAVKAINAARIALKSSGQHHVSLDSVIKTMRETGADMKTKYKETSRGGLAVNVTEC
ncbi:MAG: L-serine ammonia-lyase [Oligoflexus sp.]